MNAICDTTADLSVHLEACYGSLGFATAPFRITPDTEFLVPQHQYREAISHLRFGLATGSFTLLTGDVGLGKTLLCRYLMQHLPANVRTAYIFNPQQNYAEFLRSILYDLTGKMPRNEASSALLHDALFTVLARLAGRGKRVALVIDEAHCLPPELLEGLRLLSNLETGKRKLLSLLLVGQNELEQTLQAPEMRALRQRISVWQKDLRSPALPVCLPTGMRVVYPVVSTRYATAHYWPRIPLVGAGCMPVSCSELPER